MKTIFISLFLLFAELIAAQEMIERDSSHYYGAIVDPLFRDLDPIFPIDTSGTFGGRVVSAEMFDRVQFREDTLYVNYGLYYMGKHYNFEYTQDSIAQLTDTILFRVYPYYIIDEDNSAPLDTIYQKYGFYWVKAWSLPVDTFISPADTALGKEYDNQKCFKDDPRTFWQNLGADLVNYISGFDCMKLYRASVCERHEFCDLNSTTTENWCSGITYTKIFEDDFDESINIKRINPYNWFVGGVSDGREFGSNASKGWAANRNAVVSNGSLKLICSYDASVSALCSPTFTDDDVPWGTSSCKTGSLNYANGFIRTNFRVGYGKFEIRAKIPPILGVNPSYWIWGPEVEIDGFEFFSQNQGDRPKMTIYSSKNDEQCSCKVWNKTNNHFMIYETHGGPMQPFWNDLPNLSDGQFRIFTIVYDPNYISWWVEDEVLGKKWVLTYYNKFQSNAYNKDPNANCNCTGCNTTRAVNFPDHLSQGVYFILQNMANGTSGPTSPYNTYTAYIGPPATTPSTFEIDWVKIYTKDDCGQNKTRSSGCFSSTVNNSTVNTLTGNTITLGGSGASNSFSVIATPTGTTRIVLDQRNGLYVRANDEVQLEDGFIAENGSVFEATNAFRGNGSILNDCQNVTFETQLFRTYSPQNANTPSSLDDKENTFKLFPNPTNDFVIVQTDNAIEKMEIIDVNGRIVKKYERESKTIDLRFLSQGMYFLKIYFKDSVKNYKFIKE